MVVNGKIATGHCAMWRYPLHLPTDVAMHIAVRSPKGCILARNALYLSRHGMVNSELARGNLDGDINFVSMWDPLVWYGRATEEAVRGLVDLPTLAGSIDSLLALLLGSAGAKDMRVCTTSVDVGAFSQCLWHFFPRLVWRPWIFNLGERCA